ncbi:hypothetical protein BBP00_00001001 [Phytophthora kernoviae]|uniref:CHK kinase-like domain-containing protein n=1 Tax=Phytophthora kernoviae TaxID=325452 RepID=A0A3F2S1C9_9STRA|nr:hypothetical protein BBP00_00001001 [Phytophthora kernoviae]
MTTGFLQQVLHSSYPTSRVASFQWEPMNIGVIAEVVIITVQLEANDDGKTMETKFVGKFLRPEFPFESMFAVESKFYNDFTTKFPGCWAAFLDDIQLESPDKARLTTLCEQLSKKPDQLTKLHDLVDQGPSSLIHGDFHIANMLLSTDPAEETTWLLDWATCGKGNPLRDLAFFFIVSVQASHRQAQEAQCLKVYHEALTKETEAAYLSLDELHHKYKLCILNQFVILVVFDNLSKSLAANAKTEKLRVELDAHFREVNRRACLSVLDNLGEKDLQLLGYRCS